jgi:thioredoxin-dependent peroxiredoxin
MKPLLLVCAAVATLGLNPQERVLQPGDLAPDFSLAASDGHTYRLSDYRGVKPVVIAWFPRANTKT